jgi:hypothetical protein
MAVAGRVAAQALDNLQALADRRAEVARALDQVALIQVIRANPHLDEAVDELALDVDAIVDSGEEDRLVADGDPRSSQLVDRACHLGVTSCA